jgi:enoyl-CoA hydratase/carnithine racemase
MQEMDNGLAYVERDGHRADVVIDRPAKRNALTVDVMRDLTQAFEAVGADEDVRAVTLLGEGPVFCAGMDLRMMRERVETDAGVPRDAFPTLLEAVESTPQPVVVGIKRAAPAGAFELTLPADVRLIGADATYGVIEVKLGTFPHGGATQRLPRLVGLSKAKELVLTGDFIDPEAARECGLVAEVVDPDAVDERTRTYADDLATNAPLGMRRAKTALEAALEMPLEEGLAFERALGRELDDTRDYREGFEARVDDREPTFEGR